MNITKRQTITLLRKVQRLQIELSSIPFSYLTIDVHTPDTKHDKLWFVYTATINGEHMNDGYCYYFRTYEDNLKIFEEFKENVLSHIK